MQCPASSEPKPQPAGGDPARSGRRPRDDAAQDVFAAVLAALPLPGGPIPTPADTSRPQGAASPSVLPAGVAGLDGPLRLIRAGQGNDAPGTDHPPSAGQSVAVSGDTLRPPEAAATPAEDGPAGAARSTTTRVPVADATPDPLPVDAIADSGRLSGAMPEDLAADAPPEVPADVPGDAPGESDGTDAARQGTDRQADGEGGSGAGGEGARRGRGEGGEAALAALSAGDHRGFRIDADRERPVAGPVPGSRDDPGVRAGARVADTVARSAGGPIEVTLAPTELGRVHLAFRDQDGALSLSLSADRPETLDLMRRHADLLEKDLRLLGYGSISFQFGQGSSGSRAAVPPPIPAGPDQPAATDPVPVRPSSGPVLGAGASLDIRL